MFTLYVALALLSVPFVVQVNLVILCSFIHNMDSEIYLFIFKEFDIIKLQQSKFLSIWSQKAIPFCYKR